MNNEKSVLDLTIKEIKTIIINKIHKNNRLNELSEDFINKHKKITTHNFKDKIISNIDFHVGNPVGIVEEILNNPEIYGHILIKKSPIYYLFQLYESVKSLKENLSLSHKECITTCDELTWHNKHFFFRLINNKKDFIDKIKNERQKITTEFSAYNNDEIYYAAQDVVWFMIRENYLIIKHKK